MTLQEFQAARLADKSRQLDLLVTKGKVVDISEVEKSHALAIAPKPATRAVAPAMNEVVTTADKFLDTYKAQPANTRVRVSGNLLLPNNFPFRDRVLISPDVTQGCTISSNSPTNDSNGWVAKNAFACIQPNGTSSNGFDDDTGKRLMKLRWNVGGVFIEAGAQNMIHRGMDLVLASQGNYYNRLGVWAGNGAPGVDISGVWFHDSPRCDRFFELWGPTNGKVQNNRLYNVHDGGHVEGLTSNFLHSDNVMRRIKRMGLEFQDEGTTQSGNNNQVLRNIITDFDPVAPDAFHMCFGISFMPQRALNCIVGENYIDTGTAVPPAGDFFAIGIEWGCGNRDPNDKSVLRNNTVIGPWGFQVICSMNGLLTGNKLYGQPHWFDYTTEGGLNGQGSLNFDNPNTNQKGLNNPPPPPIVLNSDGSESGSTPPTTTMTLTLTNPTDIGFDYEITNAPAGVTSGTMYVKDGSAKMIGSQFPIAAIKGTIVGCPTNWGLLISVSVGTATASGNTHTTGAVASPWPQSLTTMQPAVKTGTTPPASGVSHYVEHREFDSDGKTITNDTGVKASVTPK